MKRILVLLVCLGMAATARADATRDASRHFQRGVDLYNDGDFRGALVEFKKAYELWPRANVLYDIGQTQYQLLDYAGALGTMNRYLAETGSTAAHRPEVEATVETLRGRVGRLALTTDVAGCEVTIDDQPSGTTPLSQSLLVSVGQRRVGVNCAGRPPQSRQIEVVAGERQELELKLPPPLIPRAAPPPPAAVADKRLSYGSVAGGWISTGLLLGATVAVGSSTLVESKDLSTLKRSYPVSAGTLDRQGSLVERLSIVSDVLGAGALIAAGVSTYLTVRWRKESAPHPRRVAWNGSGFTF
jgi:PEGA domain